MSGNSINFDDEKVNKSDFYINKNKKIFSVDDIDVNKILVSKKGTKNSFYHMAKIIRLYALLDVLIMMLLHHYL